VKNYEKNIEETVKMLEEKWKKYKNYIDLINSCPGLIGLILFEKK
jgi:hypothetical protein